VGGVFEIMPGALELSEWNYDADHLCWESSRAQLLGVSTPSYTNLMTSGAFLSRQILAAFAAEHSK
jgi:hypothetical protein